MIRAIVTALGLFGAAVAALLAAVSARQPKGERAQKAARR